MKIKLVHIFLFMTFILVGCSSYRDINEVVFTTAIVVDIDDHHNPIVYMETFHTFRNDESNTDEGTRIVLKGKGNTIFEAIRNLNHSANFKVNVTQNNAIIFTEKAAKYGLDNFLDFLIRDQELLLRPYIMICKDKPAILLETRIKQERFLGFYLEELLRNKVVSPNVGTQKLYEYANQRASGNNVEVMGILKAGKDVEPDIAIEEGAVLENDKMIGELSKKELITYNFLAGNIKTGLIIVPNPQHEDKYVTLEIVKNKTKTNVEYDGSTIYLKKNFKIRFTLGEAQQSINLNSEKVRKELEQQVRLELLGRCKKLFQKWKDNDVDIFHVKEAFERKYPNTKVDDVIANTTLKIDFSMYIEGSSDVENFK